MPTGPVVGKVLKLGKLRLDLFAQVMYDPMRHNDASTNVWTAKINVTLLFPK